MFHGRKMLSQNKKKSVKSVLPLQKSPLDPLLWMRAIVRTAVSLELYLLFLS